MKNLKFTVILLGFMFSTFSCQETQPDLPNEELEFFALIQEGLEYAAGDLRESNSKLSDLNMINESLSVFLANQLGSQYSAQNLNNYKGISNDNDLPDELEIFMNKQELLINQEIENASSFNELKSSLYNMVEFMDSELSLEKRNALILLVNLQIAYTEFIYSNTDLIDGGSSASLDSPRNGVNGWWSDIKQYAKCAVSVVTGTITGTLTGCVGLGGLAFAISGGIATLPVSGVAAIEGCLIGGVLGGLAGAGAGAVRGGCFEL